MSALEIILELRRLNVGIKVENQNLKLSASKGAVDDRLINQIRDNKSEIINILLRNDSVNFRSSEKKEWYPTSSAQRRMYSLQLLDKKSKAYNIPRIIGLGNNIDIEKIERIFILLIKRHESFRSSFHIINDEIVQKVHEDVNFKISVNQIKHAELQKFMDDFVQAFDLSKPPLMKVGIVHTDINEYFLIIDIHHIISDVSSSLILEKEFNELYNNQDLVVLPFQYKDYSVWQNSKVYKQIVKQQESFWLKQFQEEISALQLPYDYARPTVFSSEGAKVSFILDKEETKHIKKIAEQNGMTLYMVLFSAYAILFSKLSQQEDIIIGTPLAGRNYFELENIVGMFVNTLAIRNEVRESDSIKDFLQRVKRKTLESFDNQDYQFEDLVEKVVERDISRNSLFDVMFNLLNQVGHSGDLSKFEGDHYVHRPGISKFDLSLDVVDCLDQLLLSIEYCTKLFKAETIDRYIGYFKRIIDQLSGNPDAKISNIEIISEEEKQQLLYTFNNTQADYPKNKTIHQLFEEQVERTPDNVALVSGNLSITYRELKNRYTLLADYLNIRGIGLQDKIGLMVENSIEMVIGIFGILKVGGAYVPIDPEYPNSRIKYIIDNSELQLILSTRFIADRLDSVCAIEFIENIHLDQDTISDFRREVKTSDLCYIIYTSGSTGEPKGVMVEHRNVVSYINSFQKEFALSSKDIVMQQASIAFDTFVEEIYPILTQGGKLVIFKKDDLLDSARLGDLILKNNITVISCSPLLMNEINLLQSSVLRSVNLFISGGDELRYTYINNLLRFSRVYNTYGPTETTVCSLYHQCGEQNTDNIPIGRPVMNEKVYILGKNMELLPIGVQGELCIGGEGVSRGYLNNENLNIQKFKDNPFGEGRLYKSGDLARWLPDGNIEFLGRIDHQVKIRGFRIELGEIENALLKHERIKESVVIDREDKGNKYLCAYVVVEGDFSHEDYRNYLSRSLPDYMIPSYFVVMESLPLTTNGKINRKVLPSPEVKAGDDYVAPSNPLEEQLVKIWSEVLNIPHEAISVKANFYKVGGNSLLSITLLNKIEQKLGERIQLSAFLQNPTIRDLSTFIYQLFSWSANFHLDDSVIKKKNVISTVKIANLQTKGENLPIFFVAPLGGILPATSIVGIMDLPLLLGENQPFYSIQAPPLFSDLAQAIYTNGDLDLNDYKFKEDVIQQYVSECIQSIKNIYNGDQLYIGGFCTGCIFAMELAKQIEKFGFNVNEVFLIDPPLIENFSDQSVNDLLSQISAKNINLADLAWFIAKDLGWKEQINLQEVSEILKSANKEEIWEVGVDILKSHKTVKELTTSKELKVAYFTKYYNQELITIYLSMIDYKYPRIDADKTSLIFAGMGEAIKDKGFANAVSKYFTNKFVLENISGDHGSVFQPPNINQLVEIITRNINPE